MTANNMIYKAYYHSPVGILEIVGTTAGIRGVNFVKEAENIQSVPYCLEACYVQLDEYFKGIRKEFSFNLLLEGTDFQKKVWHQLLKIPYGQTVSYKQVAEVISSSRLSRAVGQASHNNPIAVIIPCHRVIGSNGNLTGYADGLWRKEWLLNHEKIVL